MLYFTVVYILTKGGAAATIASIDLIQYDPQVITFGAPKAIIDCELFPCTTINDENHFRFQNTGEDAKYDFTPFQLNFQNERHVGWPILLDDTLNPLATPGFNMDQSRLRCSLTLHGPSVYADRITTLINRNCFPIPVSKWPNGHYCTRDNECASLSCECFTCQ